MEPLKVEIQSTFDPKGTDAAQLGVKEVGKAAETTAQSTKSTADATSKTNDQLKDLSKYGAAGTQILQGLERAGRGGLDAIYGLAGAVRGVVAAVTAGTGPIGILVAGVGLLGGAFLALGRNAKEGGAETEEALEGAREAAEKLGAVRLKRLRDELDETSEKATVMLGRLEQAIQVADRFAKAEAAARAAERENDPRLSEEEKRRGDARDRFDVRRREIESGVKRAAGEAVSAQGEVDAAAAAEAVVRQQAQSTAEAQRAAVAERERLQQEAEALRQRRTLARVGSQSPFAPGFSSQDAARLKEVEERLSDSGLPQVIESLSAYVAADMERIRVAVQARAEAEEKAAAAAQKLADERAIADKELESATRVRDAELRGIQQDENKRVADEVIERNKQETLERGTRANDQAAAKLGADAERGVRATIGTGSSPEAIDLGRKVLQAADALKDGADGSELRALNQAMDRLADAAEKAGSQTAARLRAMADNIDARIARLEQQIRAVNETR